MTRRKEARCSDSIGDRSDAKHAIVYPSAEVLVLLNKSILEEIRADKHDRHLVWHPQELLEIIDNVKAGHGDIYDRATSLLIKMTVAHPFKSGNKRTALAAATGFLSMNGEKVHVREEPKVMEGIRDP